MKKIVSAALLACTSLTMMTPASAETPHAGYRETGQSQDWTGIYSPDRGTEKPTASCAIYSRPIRSTVFEGETEVEEMRGELAAFLAWDGNEITNRSGVASFMIGTDVVEGADDRHGVTIDGKTRFELLGAGDRLYVVPEDDKDAIAAMRAGTEMVVTAHTADGKITKDSYSLMGVVGLTETQKRACR